MWNLPCLVRFVTVAPNLLNPPNSLLPLYSFRLPPHYSLPPLWFLSQHPRFARPNLLYETSLLERSLLRVVVKDRFVKRQADRWSWKWTCWADSFFFFSPLSLHCCYPPDSDIRTDPLGKSSNPLFTSLSYTDLRFLGCSTWRTKG